MIDFGAEIWGWKEWKNVEWVQEEYIRWVLGLNERTPRYMERGKEKGEVEDKNGQESDGI